MEKVRKNLARELLDLETDLHARAVEAHRMATRVRNLAIIFNPGAVAPIGIPGAGDSLPPQVSAAVESLLAAVTSACVGQPVGSNELEGSLVATEGSEAEQDGRDQALDATVHLDESQPGQTGE